MKNFIKIISILFTLSFANQVFSSNNQLQFSIQSKNLSSLNNDVQAQIVEIKNGKAPFVYQWSSPEISLDSSTANGLHEGKNYTITITDSLGQISSKTFRVMPTSAEEKLNYFFGIMVDGVASVLMVDIFDKFGLYDPTMYDSNKKPILHPNGTPKKTKIPLIVFWLFLGALFFTIYYRGINFRGFSQAIKLVRGVYDNPKHKGQITHFQALATALSGTVGLGNIAGVALAIGIGGPGATFWMILMGLLGMASKFTEASLGVKYRKIDKRGHVSGGPMYYLQLVFGTSSVAKKAGKVLAGIFALLLIGASIGGGNMFQANQAFLNTKAMIPSLSNYGLEFGIGLSILTGVVILGGISSIAKVTEKLVPFMAGIYIVASLIIIGANITEIGSVFKAIYNGAFTSTSLYGGFIGVMVMGIQRAAFSNEAGIGSAAIAHSAVKTNHPVSEGIVALLEPFIDTVIICSLTAFVLIFTGYATPEYTSQFQGAELTSEAFGSVLPWFRWILLLVIFLFAFSTLISWSYYGLKGFDYLFGSVIENRFGSRQISDTIFKMIFLFFIIVGTTSSAGNVIDFSDMMLLCLAFPNMIGLYLFAPRIKKDLNRYMDGIKTGRIKAYK